MARVIEIYPKVVLGGSTWRIRVKMRIVGTRQTKLVERTFPAGVSGDARLLKLVMICRVPDSVTPEQLGGGLFDHVIGTSKYPGTFWDHWQEQAEARFGSGWNRAATKKLRDGLRTMIGQLGGEVLAVHHHEADGTNTDESS